MTSKKKNTKKNGKFQLEDLLATDSENLLAEILQLGVQQLMELERDQHIGAAPYERSDQRRTSRNGYKPRQLYTRVGTLHLRVPQTRDGAFYPSILERYQRSEKALVAALAEAYVQGVSTRKMAKVTERLLGKEFSASTISRFSEQLDTELEAWRSRPLPQDYPYVKIDARYERCRRDGIIVDMAVLVAIGVAESGHRHVLAVETGWGESEAVWSRFIKGLKERGLSGVQLFVSDNHPGIKAALRDHYSGIPWQRCQYHFLGNATERVPKKQEEQIQEALQRVWRKENSYRQAKARLGELIEELEGPLPDVADWLSEEAPQTLTVFRVAPETHRRRLRTTNAVERLHQELKRRSKPVRIFPNPDSCLRLFGAMLKEQHEDWITGRRYLKMNQLEEFKKKQKSSSEDPPKKIHQPAMAE
ncbi:Transposase (or an inactivated derivative) [Fodinibius roseus]|uniref:Mutator family transposase n=1 Tax=Fodinibius roseus TaxID=1194090 RepID=A0A1M5MCW8_9BACT|nr:IS256 family transposase [Fodinibius roseus]SHG75234.1 Transposase (or an inactivated derivative) [Fodinibius roseus]